MSKLIFIALIAGVLYLAFFNKPKHHTADELQDWFSSRLDNINRKLEQDIELDKQGKYPHHGKQTFDRRGTITYHLLDKKYARFDLSELDPITPADIMSSAAWSSLEATVRDLGLSVQLEEVTVDGDEVDSYESLDEYIDDIPRYYTVTVSGW